MRGRTAGLQILLAGFDSLWPCQGCVAQLEERRSEKPEAGGSIPPAPARAASSSGLGHQTHNLAGKPNRRFESGRCHQIARPMLYRPGYADCEGPEKGIEPSSFRLRDERTSQRVLLRLGSEGRDRTSDRLRNREPLLPLSYLGKSVRLLFA